VVAPESPDIQPEVVNINSALPRCACSTATTLLKSRAVYCKHGCTAQSITWPQVQLPRAAPALPSMEKMLWTRTPRASEPLSKLSHGRGSARATPTPDPSLHNWYDESNSSLLCRSPFTGRGSATLLDSFETHSKAAFPSKPDEHIATASSSNWNN